MKRNYIVAAILAFPVFMLFFWVLSVQNKINNAETVMVAVTGYDPRDLLSGHYVVLRPVWDDTDYEQFNNNKFSRNDFDYSYRFYLPEEDAEYLDRVVGRTRDLKMFLEFAMPANSKPIVKELYIEGLKWKEWLDKNPAPKNENDRYDRW
ncbi:MAG: GDYXXLXY domain-containing protein [Lactobacillaceae bacterium]|jgi:PAS domain-containing protein|nr:GDYXXLXY domain-containing protein [Lactobacillaceae bacterium]